MTDEQQNFGLKAFQPWAIHIGAWIVALCCGGLRTWTGRDLMTQDGIPYLEIGEAFMDGNWFQATNAYWGPLYGWLQGFIAWMVKPNIKWEYPLAHLVNFLLFLIGLSVFQLFMHKLISATRGIQGHQEEGKWEMIHEWCILLTGNALYIWSGINLITVDLITPDLMLAIFTMTAAIILLDLDGNPLRTSCWIKLGITLGVAYWVKSPVIPLTVCLYILLVFIYRRKTDVLLRWLLSLVVFLLIAMPYVFLLHERYGYWTFGDSGRLNYLWQVNNEDRYVHWQGDDPQYGEPVHPTRRLDSSPVVYEFDEPFDVTYAPWFDPAYWYSGADPRLDIFAHSKRIAQNVLRMMIMLIFLYPVAWMGLLALWWEGAISIARWQRLRLVIFWAALPLIMYLQILVLPRYISSFLAILFITAIAMIRIPTIYSARRLARAVILTIAAVMLISTVMVTAMSLPALRKFRGRYQPTILMSLTSEKKTLMPGKNIPNWEIASAIHELGIKSGDKIAFLGGALVNTYWARLARVEIIAEIVPWDMLEYWELTETEIKEMDHQFADMNVKALVTREYGFVKPSGWQQIGKSDFFMKWINVDPD